MKNVLNLFAYNRYLCTNIKKVFSIYMKICKYLCLKHSSIVFLTILKYEERVEIILVF